MNMELQAAARADIFQEMRKDDSGLSLTNLESLAECSLRRAFASKVIWMSKQFDKIESVEEIGAWGKTMNFLCKSMSQSGKVGKDKAESACLKETTTAMKVLTDDLRDDINGCSKNSSDIEKSESLNLGKAESSEESEDELSALSSDCGLQDEQCVSGAVASKGVSEEVQDKPHKEDKTSSTPPAVDFRKLSFGCAMPKVRVVPSLPSPFFGSAGGKVAGWRRNSFSVVPKMNELKGNVLDSGKCNGYYSADEGHVTKQLTF